MTTARDPGYETSDLPVGVAGFSVLGVLALIAIAVGVALGAYLAFAAIHSTVPATALQRAALAPPGPRLQADPRADRRRLEAQATASLQAYGWADRAAGRARIPIDRAMALQAQLGWPDQEAHRP